MSQLVDLLNTFGGYLLRSMLRLSVELVVLAAVVLAVIYLLRVRSPGLRHLFWCLVLAKPVATFLVASPISLYWFLHPVRAPLPPPAPPAAVVRTVAVDYAPRMMAYRPRPRAVSMPAPAPAPPWWSGMRANGVIASLWLAGASLLALRLIFGFAFVSFLRRTAIRQEGGPLGEIVERARCTLRLRRRTPVALSLAVHGPVLAGVLRPAVLLPEHMLEQCTAQQVELVVAHELAHARRMDNLALLVQRLAEVVLFFHPVVWLCGWVMRRESESACDYAVIAAYSAAARADASALYADSLTRVAEMRSGITRRLLINTFAAVESNLAGRVRRIIEGRLTRRTLVWTFASVAALLAVAVIGLPTAARPGDEALNKSVAQEKKMDPAGEGLRYGFRHDPMKYVEGDASVPAALVRAQVFGAPNDGDERIIADYVAEILAKQRPDGSFGDKSGDTGRSLDWLAVAGVGADSPEFMRGYQAMMRQREVEATSGSKDDYGQEGLVLVPVNGLRAACMTDLVSTPEVRRTVRWLADHPDLWLKKTCPWGATFVLRALWHAREVEDVGAGIDAALDWIGAQMNAAGCVSYWDPYAVVGAVGTIDTPKARALLLREVPMLLRGQEADGGWGPNKWDMQTLDAFRALKTHGLLEKLRALPPLPPDWRVVRSIPAPEGDLGPMTYQAGRLWFVRYGEGEVLGISPEDGSVVKTLRVPGVWPEGVGQWDGALALSQKDPKRVMKVDPESGAIEAEIAIPFAASPMTATMVNGKLWIADGWLFPGWVIDPAHPDKLPSSEPDVDWDPAFRLEDRQAGTCPNGLAALPDGVWQTDYFARAMIKSSPDGKLTDWAERPFGGWPPSIAYDGKDLWALDPVNHRLCVIEKTETGAALRPARAAVTPSVSIGREDGKVTIGGLEEAKWGGESPQQDTVIGAMTAVARVLGDHDVTYEYLSGVSGSAFRVQVGAEDWRIEAPFATVGLDLSQTAAAALGWTLSWMRVDPKNAAAVKVRNDAIVRSIDAGWPVLLAREECSIIVGYADAGKSLIIRQVGAGQPGYVPLKEGLAAWQAVGIIQRNEVSPWTPFVAAMKSRGLACLLWQMPDVRGFAEGKRAYDLWAQRLEDDTYYADAKKAGAACECNGYAYCSLDAARAAAAAYLPWAARQLEGTAAGADHVRRAAALYQQVVDTLRKKRDDLPEPWMLFPWDLEKTGGWTQAQRHAQAAVLRQVAALEEKAVAELALVGGPRGVEQDRVASAVRPDYATLNLRSSGPEQDSFSLTMLAAARLFGTEADYETVYALSTNGFAPDICPSEDCKSTWRRLGRGRCIDLVAEYLGLEAGELLFPEEPPLPAADAQGRTWGTPAYDGWLQDRKMACAAAIKESLDGGALVVASGGWLRADFSLWGIVTGADPATGAITGMAPEGPRDNVMDHVRDYYALRPAAGRLPLAEAERQMLARAVDRIGGRAAPFAPGEVVFGLPAMDLWIAQMQKPAFQPDDPSSSAGNALLCALYSLDGARRSGAYLRKMALDAPAGARPHLAAAAENYDAIERLLSSFGGAAPNVGYSSIMGDPARQKAHAETVLVPVKAELAAAADELAAALAAEGVSVLQATTRTEGSTQMAAKVKREGGRVEIDGVPVIAWGRSSDTTFAGAMEAALAVTDHPYTATQIMGYSGLAFRVRWAGDPDNSKPGWCPSIPVGEFQEEQAAVAKATGWRFDIVGEDNAEDARMGGHADEIAAAIEAGYPVVGYPDTADLNAAVAVGYEGAGAERKFLWRTYWTGANTRPVLAADTGPWAMIPQGFGSAPNARQRLLDTLSIAVRNWRRGRSLHPNGYPYVWGDFALQSWQKDLARAATFTEEQQKQLFFVNWWNYEAFQDARRRAAAFLKDEAPNLDSEGRDAVLRAAALYEQEGKLLAAQIEKPEGFLGPWSGKGFADWTPAVRTREQQILAQALDLERQAIAEIETALKAEGVTVPAPAESVRSLSDDDVRRLGQWQNIFGGARDKLLLGVGRYPETLRLLETERFLEPISANARAIRRAMGGLEPAEWDYADQLEDVLTAIGSGAAPAGRDETVRERKAYVEKRRRALLHWLAGTAQSEAEGAADTDATSVRLTYSLLGTPDAEKRLLTQMVADKLGPDGVKSEDLAKLEASATLAPFAHRIDMHGYQLWSFDSNHELLLRSIGRKQALGEWHTPGGPLAWGDGDPEDRRRVEAMLDRLEKWLAGAPDAMLGAPDAYREKVWLARCLALYLRDHRDNYYGWSVAATTPANVRREDGKVWLPGMENVTWGGPYFEREDSQARCLVEALRCAGQDVSYADVMGLSGAAFKITMAPNLFVAEIHSEMGMDWQEIVSRVWGMDYRALDEGKEGWRDHLFSAATESIGRGMPLFYRDGEWNLLVGYREDGSGYVCKPYDGRDAGYTEFEFPRGLLEDAWFVSVLRPVGKPADRRDSVLHSLRTAVELSIHPAKADGSRLFGFAAYEAWIAALDEDRKDASKHGNDFSYSQLLTSRRAGAEYLRKIANELGADAAPHLRTAADRYDAIAMRLDTGRACARPWDQDWTAENRAKEAAILRQCLADERAGVSEITAALAALGETAPVILTEARSAVLLQDAVADFRHIADDVAGHRSEVLGRGATDDFYPQPYCRLTTMLVQMHAAGWKEMDFDTLAAVSGASAMFGYEPNEFGPKYAWHWRAPNALVAQATGYATEKVPAATAEDAYKFVRQSVDSGRPVSAWEGEMMLLAGYQDAAAAADRKVFAMKDGNGYYAEWWDWDRFSKWVGGGQDLYRHSSRVEPKPSKEVALRVMGDLVALSAGVPQSIRNSFPKATFGLAGIEAWAVGCADMEKHEDWGMCHPENPQWTVRNSTAAYLENLAKQDLLSSDANSHVLKAAAQYRSAYAAWQQAYGQVGYAAPEGSGKVKERRLAAAAAVRRAAEYEKAGIAEVTAALEAEGVEVQSTSAAAGAASEVVLDIPGMPEDMLDKGLADRGCQYQAGVARAYVYALRHAGVDIGFTEFTALSGWAFSFVYNYGNCPQVGIRVRGTAGERGPGETFQIADWFGLAYESAPTQDRDRFWAFVKEQIGAGRPVISEHGDGGLIVGYRERDGKLEARFASFTGGQWMDISGFEPFEVCALVPRGQALPKRDLYLRGLRRAVYYATMPEWKGAATGLAGLDTYVADVADPAKDFANHSDWFCWAAFNRIDARVCAADWLGEAADVVGGDARRPLLAAADQYARAFKSYSEFQAGLGGGDDSAQTFLERIRKPGKISALVPLLKAGIEAERAGLAELKLALLALNAAPPDSGAGTPPSGGDPAAGTGRGTGEVGIDGVSLAECHSPDENWGASLPRAMAVALKHAGRDVSFSDMAAGSGWAFSFGYNYSNWHVAALSVGQFDWLPEQLGYPFDSVGFADRDNAWQFITGHLDAGTPVVSTLGDGGLITAYRVQDGKREFLFDGVPSGGWQDVNAAHPLDRCAVAVKSGEPMDRAQIARDSLPRALKAAKEAQGALDAYLADVEDQTKGFDGLSEWFCWATFERLSARGCCADWLRNAAGVVGGDARAPLLAAAEGYERAYAKYSEYDALVHADADSGKTLQEQVRTPAKIAALVPVLKAGVQAERAGIAQLEAAVRALGGPVPAVTITAAAAGPKREDGKVSLDGLKWFPSWMTLPGCLVACSRGLGMDNSPDWVYGSTAFAFALNVHRTLCPSGPTAWGDGDCAGLARNMGMRVEYLIADNGGGQLAQRQEEFFGRVGRAIDAGLPVIGWEMDVPDYYVVHGYDAEGNYLFRNFDDTVGRTSKTKLGDSGIGILQLLIVHPQAPADDRTTVRQALTLALDIAAGKHCHGGEYAGGMAGYDQWIKALAEPEAVLADENAAYGLAYNAACWEDCRSHAPGFLQEAQKRLTDPSLDADFAAAIASYRKAAAGMKKVKDLFPFDHAQKEKMAERLRDAALRAQALEALRSARAAEAEGLRSLAALVQKLGGPHVDVAAIVGSGRVVLENVPPVGGEGNGYVRGIEVLLAGAGTPVAYERLMGLSGMAFIAQADTGHRWEGKVDVGWWPLDLWGLEMRRDFLARSVGYELREVGLQVMDPTEEEVKAASADLPRFYRDHVEKHVKASIDAGRPVLGIDDFGFVITGYDDATDAPPVFGRCPRSADSETGRAESWPYGLIVLGARKEPMETDAADAAALQYAVALANDQAGPTDPRWRDRRFTGQKAFAAWAALLRDADEPVEDRHHANMVGNLRLNRTAAVAYLRAVAGRQEGEAAAALGDAAVSYESSLSQLSQMKWSGLAASMDARRKLADQVDRLAATELEAAGHIQRALQALGKDAVATSTGPAPDVAGNKHMLAGLECVPMTCAELSAVGGALKYLGRDVSNAWLYGATGHAFAINIRPTVCVSSPYAWQKTLYELAPNIGCRITGFAVSRQAAGEEFPARQREAWDMVRAAVDRGLPCYADRVSWMPDYSLITGYDDVGYYYTHANPGARGGPTAWQKLGTEDIEFIDVWRVELCDPKPDDQVVRAALGTVLEHAATPDGWVISDGHRSGPWAFDLWADELELGHAKLDDHTYNAHFWWEARAEAVDFLKEAKRRLPGRADAAFDEAVTHYTVVRDKLGAVKDLSPFRDNADWTTLLKSPEQAALIRQAGAAERQGLAALGKVLVALGGTLPAPAAGGEGPAKASGTRFVLGGVRQVAYHTDKWRFTPFCNALDACLQYLGEPEQYDYLMCTSGAAFRMRWTAKAWDGGNSDILGMAQDTLEPMRHAFRSAGYGMQAVGKEKTTNWAEDLFREAIKRGGGELTDEAGFLRAIIGSINSGRPVIAFGIIGPPEACVVTGYDERGDVLLGWNVFQDDEKAEVEASGYFRVRDWYPKTRGLLLVGEKVGKPDAEQLDIDTLKWALQVLRTPQVRGSAAGPAAFDAWAADMLNDEYFPKDKVDVLSARLMCHWDSMTVTAFRGGGEATAYLTAVAARQPAMAAELRAAARCLEDEDVVHGVAPGEEAQMTRLAEPAVRRQVADSILHARDVHVEAAGHIEKALLAAGVPPAEIPHPVVQADAVPDRETRVVLERVPKVGFGVVDGNVAMTPFPACLKACLEYMDDDLGFERTDGKYPRDAVYAHLMGTTGAAFRLLWGPGWRGDNVASFAIYDDAAEIFRRGFAAAGYGYEVIHRGAEAPFRERVIASVRDLGRPVIAHGVIGPPEECIIAGFDEGGRVAVGWNFFQDRVIGTAGVEFEPNDMFRKRNWEADTWSMMVIGEKAQRPERRQACTEALRNALRIMRDPLRGKAANGIAAYDAWAEHILRDDEVAAGGKPDNAFVVHCDAEDVVAEGRWYASVFLKQAAEVLPEAKDDLLAASDCFKAEHDLVWKMWGEVGGNVPSDATRKEFLKPEVRRSIVPLIRQCRDKDAEAAGHIEKALLALGVPQKDIAPVQAAPAAMPEAPSGKTMLAGLEFPKWTISQLGCMSACLDYLGRSVPRPWLYGGTAHAFFINIHDDVDLESVTAWDQDWLLKLTPNLGFLTEGYRAVKPEMSEDGWRAIQAQAWQSVRNCILLNRPCYGWELKAPYGDYWLITGFDDTGYYYDGWETGGPTPWRKLGEQFIPVLMVRSVQLCEPAADEVVVREALVAALSHAQPGWDVRAASDAHFGPDAYDAWAKALESGTALHNHHAYNAVAWHECREMAVEFLKEAKRRLPGRANAAFDEAIAHYTVVRDRLAAVKALTPIDDKLGWGPEQKLKSPEAAKLVREAGAAETEGLKALARIAAALGADARAEG